MKKNQRGAKLERNLEFALLDSLDIGVATVTPKGGILYANPRFAELLGRTPGETVANLKDFISADAWTAVDAALRQSANREVQGQIKVLPWGNSARTVHLSFNRIGDPTNPNIRLMATEVTQMLETAEALKQSKAFIQSLSARLLQVQDDERRRMARDLHDVTGQEIASAVLFLDRLAKNLNKPGANVQGMAAETASLLRKIEGEIRTLSYVLHPPLLDEMGLSSAVHWYVEGFAKRTGIQVEINAPSDLPRLDIEKETALFRVIQEALTNVFRHSGSPNARVSLAVRSGCLKASVQDEGHGFNIGDVASGPNSGVGLQSMRGRLAPYDGSLDLRSGPLGTEVTAIIPLTGTKSISETQPTPVVRPEDGTTRPRPTTAAGTRKRVLIADDHEVARRGLRALMSDQPDLEICGEAEDGMEAVAKASELQPDLIIMDVSMPHMGGFSAANRIHSAGIPAKILIYTTHSYPEFERLARAAGCEGFVLKSDASDDFLRAVRKILRGGTFFHSESRSRAHSA